MVKTLHVDISNYIELTKLKNSLMLQNPSGRVSMNNVIGYLLYCQKVAEKVGKDTINKINEQND